MLSFPMSWLLWLLLAALLVLPVLLRLYAGEDPPNAITHEQPAPDDGEGPDADPGPALVRTAA